MYYMLCFTIFFIFIFFGREWVQVGRGQREREGENLKQAPCLVWSLRQGPISWLEPKSRVWYLTNWATQVPQYMLCFMGQEDVWSFLLLLISYLFHYDQAAQSVYIYYLLFIESSFVLWELKWILCGYMFNVYLLDQCCQ